MEITASYRFGLTVLAQEAMLSHRLEYRWLVLLKYLWDGWSSEGFSTVYCLIGIWADQWESIWVCSHRNQNSKQVVSSLVIDESNIPFILSIYDCRNLEFITALKWWKNPPEVEWTRSTFYRVKNHQKHQWNLILIYFVIIRQIKMESFEEK